MYKPWRPKGFFNLKSSSMSESALSALYLNIYVMGLGLFKCVNLSVRGGGGVDGLGGLKETKLFLPHPRVKVSIVGSLRVREVACSASDRQGSNFEFCVWRTVSSQSSHHPQDVLLAQFSLYVHKGGLKPDSFHFISLSPVDGHSLINSGGQRSYV